MDTVDVEVDDRLAVVAITGAGEKAFVAGADIARLQGYTLHTGTTDDEREGAAALLEKRPAAFCGR
jgi:enoyl-CoA hydratase/carnithine racemase